MHQNVGTVTISAGHDNKNCQTSQTGGRRTASTEGKAIAMCEACVETLRWSPKRRDRTPVLARIPDKNYSQRIVNLPIIIAILLSYHYYIDSS